MRQPSVHSVRSFPSVRGSMSMVVYIWVDISRPADIEIRRSCHPIFHPIYGRDSRGRSDTVSD